MVESADSLSMGNAVRRLATVAAALAFTNAVLAAPAFAADCAGADESPIDLTLSEARAATLCLLNSERADRRLSPLRANNDLRDVAQKYAKQLDTEDFFDHVSPGGSTMVDRIKRSRYLKNARSWTVGENLAWGAGGAETPRKIVKAWMESPGHKRNILNARYRDIGVGITFGAPTADITASSGAATYVNNFGTRR